MLSTEIVHKMEDRGKTSEAVIDNIDFLITETSMSEERLFWSCAITDNFLRNFNSIYYQVITSFASKAIRYNDLVNKELILRSMPSTGTLETKHTTLLMRIKHE